VFSHFKALGVDNYQIYLLSGIMVYTYFSESVMSGTGSLMGMAHIILKVKFPKEIAVLSSQGLATISLFINLGILAVFAVIQDVTTGPLEILYIFFVLFILTVITYGITLFTSVITVRLRDLNDIIEVFLQLGFYLSPIIYPLDIIPVSYRPVIMYNPITIVMQTVRAALVDREIIHLELNLILLGIGIFLVIFGRLLFKKMVKKVAEYY
jgi:ABC-type polysaccharide/polyol phosphate export permease